LVLRNVVAPLLVVEDFSAHQVKVSLMTAISVLGALLAPSSQGSAYTTARILPFPGGVTSELV